MIIAPLKVIQSMKNNDKSNGQRVPQEVIDSLLETVSLLDLIKESAPVKTVKDRFVAHCPFHVRGNSEMSLNIDDNNHRFSCSVCEFGGSVIGWLMFHDGLSFQDSIIMLSKRSGIDVSQWITASSLEKSRKKKRETLKEVSQFFSTQLEVSEDARSYTLQRGISKEVIERYGIGYAPGDKNEFDNVFGKQSRQLWNEGLLVRLSDGSFGRRFRNRLMFPIRDADGHTVGFGGRVLSDGQPKYLNSPSSPTFDKSKLLYGLFESLNSGNNNDRLILVEGYVDVLTLSQYGFSGAVAALGTATSTHHIQTALQCTKQVIACFDGDSAGSKAAERLLHTALPLLSGAHQLQFALLPPGHDPDSLLKSEGREALSTIIESSIPADLFLYDELTRSIDLSNIGGLARLAAVARPVIESITSDVLRDSVINLVENTIGIPWFDIDEV